MDTPAQALTSGASALVATPETLLPLLALGLWLACCRGAKRGAPALLAGLGAGVLIAPFAPEALATVSLAVGLLVAAGTAFAGPRLPAQTAHPVAALTLSLALASLLHGQAFDSLPIIFVTGVMGAALLAVIVPLALAVALLRGRTAWRALAVRIAASWLAAILVLIIAFNLRPV